MAINATDDSFEAEVLKSDIPVLVDFWAEWCGPCKQIAPALEELAGEMEGKVKIVKVNVDECNATATNFRIQAIPTLMLFKNGEIVDRQMGALAKSRIESWVNSLLEV